MMIALALAALVLADTIAAAYCLAAVRALRKALEGVE